MLTAPRSPTQPTKPTSLAVKPNGARQIQTATGRATTIRNAAMVSAGTATRTRRDGDESRPSSRNITIWQSHVAVSWKLTMLA